MKAHYSFVVLFLCVGISSAFGAVLRVNNQIPTDHSQKIYASIQEAHDQGQSGDTLMVEGSPVVYATATFTKKLVVFGTGYFLDENPETQASQSPSRVGQINLNAGSEGTFLIGLTFTSGSSANRPTISVNDITVMRCYLMYPIFFSSNGNLLNISIIQNYFQGSALNLSSSATSFSNVVFNNNVVNGVLQPGSGENRVFSQVNHNIFRGTSTNTVNIRTALFRNNIIATNASVTILSGAVQNNLTLGSQLNGIGTGNQAYTAVQLFVGEQGSSLDGQYQLKPDSPYLTAGFGNEEPGIFGSNLPYVLSGIPPIPTIYEFSAASFGSRQNGLSIQLKAKTNF